MVGLRLGLRERVVGLFWGLSQSNAALARRRGTGLPGQQQGLRRRVPVPQRVRAARRAMRRPAGLPPPLPLPPPRSQRQRQHLPPAPPPLAPAPLPLPLPWPCSCA